MTSSGQDNHNGALLGPPIKLFNKQLTSHKFGDIKINFITLITAIIRAHSVILVKSPGGCANGLAACYES